MGTVEKKNFYFFFLISISFILFFPYIIELSLQNVFCLFKLTFIKLLELKPGFFTFEVLFELFVFENVDNKYKIMHFVNILEN